MGILVIQPVLILFFIAATFFRKPFRVLITGAFIRLLIIAALIGARRPWPQPSSCKWDACAGRV